MNSRKSFFILLNGLLLGCFNFSSSVALAQRNCVDLLDGCFRRSGMGTSSSASSQIRLNPSAVPTDDIFGLEGIFFKTEVDVMLAKGNGRVGAAISPANTESTFFGPPSVEIDPIFLNRKEKSEKYESQKITLATAMDLYENKGSGIKNISLKLGLMGKYNKQTNSILAGAGLTGVMGPLNFGYSYYRDETELNFVDAYGPLADPAKSIVRYKVQTYSVGLYLNSLILDYSNLNMLGDSAARSDIVNLYTASLILGRLIVTASRRIENSSEPAYNYATHLLEYNLVKEETFGGVQIRVHKHLSVGALYNYYLLREYSVMMTLFF